MLLRDLLDLPDQVRKGDFVLNLADGVTAHAAETVRDYVPTPQLVKCFDEALGLIKSALESNKSKAAYLHGSFGSGKSHFMAILLLMLERNIEARSIPDLSEVVARHNAWTEGRKFLLVPYHMLGAKDMESAILGGYVAHVRKHHPTAPTPAVYRSEALLADARRLRGQFGDAMFFDKLNEGAESGDGDGWGDISERWDAKGFEEAAVTPDSPQHRRLVGDLVDRFFTNVRENADGFIDLDKGLSVISQHAKALGYHGLILFLDELILWLASHAADIDFLNREGTKLPKLVEAQHADRPAPIISFIARQRDLRELVGDHIAGSLQLGFSDILRFWEARFSTIKLEDRNLPAIAEKRVLKAKDGAAKAAMDTEFAKTEKIREPVMKVLLTQSGNRADFRKLYPFTPALVETLVALSALLQRERTALKIMLQLLVEQKDRLKLGELVPVGDLFDAIAEGDEAFNDVMKAHFENARKLWTQRLRPLLLSEHSLSVDQLESLPYDDQRIVLFRNDARLVKTLLLASLAPEVESLKLMTASRLSALNYGSIKSPIVGQETSIVLNKVRKWAGQVGQIRISDDVSDPTIQVQLSDVDTEAILEKAAIADNPGERARKIKELLFAQMKIADQGELWVTQPFTWRGTKRMCEVLFTNVRETMDETLRNENAEAWKVIVDYPFDTPGHTPTHDVARLRKFRDENPAQRTIVWVPSFFGLQSQRDLSAYVRLEHILTGDRFGQFVTHLSAQDQAAAKTQLENQRQQLRARLILHLEAAYGIHPAEAGSLDTAHELESADQFQSLDQALDLRPPVSANLREAFVKLVEQAMTYQFPAHPDFEEGTNLGNATLKRVLTEIENAARTEDGRIAVEQPMRLAMKQIAEPLKLGQMGQTHFQVGQHWRAHLEKEHSKTGGAISVGKLRDWLNAPKAMGLPLEVQNLVILAFAAQTNRAFYQHGTAITPTLEKLENHLELREETMPAESEWKTALERASLIFGLTPSPLLNAANLAKFCEDVRKASTALVPKAAALVKQLRAVPPAFINGDPASAPRLATAVEAASVLDLIGQHDGATLVETLGSVQLSSSPVGIGTSLASADVVGSSLQGMSWDILDGLHSASGEHTATAQSILAGVSEALATSEHAMPLRNRLQEAQKSAVALLKAMATKPSSVVDPPTVVSPPVIVAPPMIPPAQDEIVLVMPAEFSALLAKNSDVRLDLVAGSLTIVATSQRFKLRVVSQS